MASTFRYLSFLTFIVGAAASGVMTLAAQQRAPEKQPVWPGSITRTQTFSGHDGRAKVTYRREERWDTFVVSSGEPDGSTAFFDTTWTLHETKREVTERCVTTMEAHGSAAYPWLTFDVNPLDEVSYHLYSTGTGGGPEIKGTLTQTCRGEGTSTTDYVATPHWLPGVPFPVPAEFLPEGVEIPQMDQTALGPAVFGTLDPKTPNLLRGSVSGKGSDGSTITLTWNLSRSADCGSEQDARDLVSRESNRLRSAESTAAAEGGNQEGPRATPAPAAPNPHITSNQPLSDGAVSGALRNAAGNPDRIAVRELSGTDRAGIRRFAIRLSADGRALRSLEALKREIDTTCVPPGSMEGAPVLLVGAVQWAGDRFRIDVRTVQTETGTVTDTVSDSGTGGAAELQMALEALLGHYVRGA